MKTKLGPTRIIVIRSGPYDYTEIDFSQSCHLVGSNNFGKTTLISVLQFLFVSDFNETYFGAHEWNETKRFYFPSNESYILFECATASGRFVTVGLHGAGPLAQFEIKRFAYAGTYSPEDFLSADRKSVRPFEEIRDRLAAEKGYEAWAPKHLRAALLGEAESKQINLGIVPLADTSQYSRFTRLFKNLLRLNNLTQEDIKQTLIEVYKTEFQQSKISLVKDHADLYDQVNREKLKLDALRQVEPIAQQLREAVSKRDNLKRMLPALWTRLEAAKRERIKELSANVDHFKKCGDEEAGRQVFLEEQRSDKNNKKGMLDRQIGALSNSLQILDKSAENFANFLSELAQQSANNLDSQIAELQGRLHGAALESVAALEQTCSRLRANQKRLIGQRDNYASLLGTKLKQWLPSENLSESFKLLNPAILGLAVPDQIDVRDKDVLASAIKALCESCESGVFEGFGISVRLDAFEQADVAKFVDVAVLNGSIEAVGRELSNKEQLLGTARSVAELQQQLLGLKELHEKELSTLNEYRQYRDQEGKRAEWKKELGEKEKNIARIAGELSDLRQQTADSKEVAGRYANSIRSASEELARIHGERYDTPPGDWPTGLQDSSWPDDFSGLLPLYRSEWETLLSAEKDVASFLYQIEVVTKGGYAGESEAETVEMILEAIDSIPDQESNLDDMWKNLLTSIRTALNGLLSDVRTLEDKARDFNRHLSGFSVSDLKGLSLEIIENRAVTDDLRGMLAEEGTLFGSLDETETAIQNIGNMLRARPEIHLRDLFGVRFCVEMANGKKRIYDDLSTIESNGTTITIKVLVNIMLLKDMMKKGRAFSIPFYLDEADSIDDDNLREIVGIASRFGFVAVLASPSPRPIAHTTYFVHKIGDRSVIDPHRKIIRESLEDEPTTA